jgi:hypothetical protein
MEAGVGLSNHRFSVTSRTHQESTKRCAVTSAFEPNPVALKKKKQIHLSLSDKELSAHTGPALKSDLISK